MLKGWHRIHGPRVAVEAEPEVLLIDEATLGIAPIAVKEMCEKILSIRERLNTSIVVVEHKIRGELDIMDRGYVLDGGLHGVRWHATVGAVS